MILTLKKRKIKINKYRTVSYFGKYMGLMFKTRETINLVFSFNNDVKMSIHSYFVFFKFLAVWIDEKNNVLEYKIVSPFTTLITPKKSFRKLIEIPFNSRNSKILEFFVGKRKIYI